MYAVRGGVHRELAPGVVLSVGTRMVLPLPRGRSRRVLATSLHVVSSRQQLRRQRRERRLLAPSRELFQRAHIVAQAGNQALASSLFEQCVSQLPRKRPDKARPAARVIRAMALTQLGQIAEVTTQPHSLLSPLSLASTSHDA